MKWIGTAEDLATAVERIGEAPTIAVDTEADSLHSYFDKVCLIQISIPGEDYLIDPLAKIDLAPLGAVLSDPASRKVLHGADYDVRILQRDFGILILNLTDTMICAQILGYEAMGLAALLKRHFDLDVDKAHQRADWAMRPLPSDMLRYAVLDTHYLDRLAAKLRDELLALGRWEWAEEEFGRLEAVRYEENERDQEAYRKIKGSSKLTRRGLAILRLLYWWRDQVAQRLDRPPFKVIGNEALVSIATDHPRNLQQLAGAMGVAPIHVRKYGEELLAIVERALAIHDDELPEKMQPKPWLRDKEIERTVDALKAARDSVAASLKISPSVLAPRHVLVSVASQKPATLDELSSIPAMREWQKKVLGPSLMEVLDQRHA